MAMRPMGLGGLHWVVVLNWKIPRTEYVLRAKSLFLSHAAGYIKPYNNEYRRRLAPSVIACVI